MTNSMWFIYLCLLYGPFSFGYCFNQPPEAYDRDCTQNRHLPCWIIDGCSPTPQAIDVDQAPCGPQSLKIRYNLLASTHRNPSNYEIYAYIAWQPPRQEAHLVQGFQVRLREIGGSLRCFTFQLVQQNWTKIDLDLDMPEFNFTSLNLFNFGKIYDIEVQTLPLAGNESESNKVSTRRAMPTHPANPVPDGSYNCSIAANPHAHSWTSAFRTVAVHPYVSEIFVEFVAAPPQFCFHRYEVTLQRPHGYIAKRIYLNATDLYEVTTKGANITFYYGNVTFAQVKPGHYSIGVQPDRYDISKTNCLCPSEGNHLCSCTLASFPDVNLKDVSDEISQLLPLQPTDELAVALDPANEESLLNNHKPNRNFYLIGVALLLLVVFILTLVGLFLYKRYGKEPQKKITLSATEHTDVASENASTAEPLRTKRVAIVYSHDCEEHDAVVASFADFLRKNCKCDVLLDIWDRDNVSKDMLGWSLGTLRADKVVIVNSVGAYMRYSAKQLSTRYENGTSHPVSLQRANCGEFDDLLLIQLQRVMEDFSRTQKCNRFLRVYFPYTPSKFMLHGVNTGLLFELPKHLDVLISCIHDIPTVTQTSISADRDRSTQNFSDHSAGLLPISIHHDILYAHVDHLSRSPLGFALQEAINGMMSKQINEPHWFETTHICKALISHSLAPEPASSNQSLRDEPLSSRGSSWLGDLDDTEPTISNLSCLAQLRQPAQEIAMIPTVEHCYPSVDSLVSTPIDQSSPLVDSDMSDICVNANGDKSDTQNYPAAVGLASYRLYSTPPNKQSIDHCVTENSPKTDNCPEAEHLLQPALETCFSCQTENLSHPDTPICCKDTGGGSCCLNDQTDWGWLTKRPLQH